jgi:hypothetical protein
LFQSDLQHNQSITLQVSTAERVRDLNHDWVHPRTSLVEVEMSLAQWGALVSSVGIGSGVPVTLRSTATDHQIPSLPYEPRIAESIRETRTTVTDLVGEIANTLAALEEAIESKSGVKVIRERLRALRARVDNAPGNAEYAVKSVQRATEEVVAQARSDIESQMLSARGLVDGPVSIETPKFEELES